MKISYLYPGTILDMAEIHYHKVMKERDTNQINILSYQMPSYRISDRVTISAKLLYRSDISNLLSTKKKPCRESDGVFI